METNNKGRKKVDLLAFQENLNGYFMDIFNSKNSGQESKTGKENLGLEIKCEKFNFLIQLQKIKNISTDLNFEKIFLTKSWAIGFNQIRGEVFTILDWNVLVKDLFDLNLEETKDHKEKKLIYLKDHKESKYGMLVNDFKLNYDLEFKTVFKKNEVLECVDESYLSELLTSNVLEIENKNLLLLFSKLIKNEKIKSEDEKLAELKEYICEVVVDNKNNLILFLDVEYLTFYLNNVSPY